MTAQGRREIAPKILRRFFALIRPLTNTNPFLVREFRRKEQIEKKFESNRFGCIVRLNGSIAGRGEGHEIN